MTWRWPSKRAETCRQRNNKVNTYKQLCFDSLKSFSLLLRKFVASLQDFSKTIYYPSHTTVFLYWAKQRNGLLLNDPQTQRIKLITRSTPECTILKLITSVWWDAWILNCKKADKNFTCSGGIFTFWLFYAGANSRSLLCASEHTYTHTHVR